MEIGYIDTPEEWRDVFVMAYAVAGLIVFLLMTIFTLIIGFLTVSILRRVRRILKDNVQPTTENVKNTAQNIRGTVEYISDTAVKPVVGVYGIAAAGKRFVTVVARFSKKDGG